MSQPPYKRREILSSNLSILAMVKRTRKQHETDEYVEPVNAPSISQHLEEKHTQYDIGDPSAKDSRLKTTETIYHDAGSLMDIDIPTLLPQAVDEYSACDNDEILLDDPDDDLEREFEAAGLLGSVHADLEEQPLDAGEPRQPQKHMVCYILNPPFFVLNQARTTLWPTGLHTSMNMSMSF